MGSKNKLKRFKENETFENVFQPTREEVVGGEFPLKGNWNTQFFKNDNKITIYSVRFNKLFSIFVSVSFEKKNKVFSTWNYKQNSDCIPNCSNSIL